MVAVILLQQPARGAFKLKKKQPRHYYYIEYYGKRKIKILQHFFDRPFHVHAARKSKDLPNWIRVLKRFHPPA